MTRSISVENTHAGARLRGCCLVVATIALATGLGSWTCRAAPGPWLEETLDTTNLVWQSTGWYPDSWLSHDGVDAANCEAVWGTGAVLQTTVVGPGVIEFWWINQCCQPLSTLSMDFRPGIGAPVSYECLSLGHWQQVTAEVPPGLQTLSWVLSGGSILAEFPFAAVDEVRYTPIATPEITEQPRSVTAAVGEPATFAVTATGPLLQYQWRHFAAAIPGATNASFTLSSVQPEHAGPYSVVVSNPAGAVPSSIALLTVLPKFVGPSFSNGLFQASLAGVRTPADVVIQASMDLTNWCAIQTNRVAGSSFLLAVPIEPAIPGRYFRAMVP